jgi:hypothetical protein
MFPIYSYQTSPLMKIIDSRVTWDDVQLNNGHLRAETFVSSSWSVALCVSWADATTTQCLKTKLLNTVGGSRHPPMRQSGQA